MSTPLDVTKVNIGCAAMFVADLPATGATWPNNTRTNVGFITKCEFNKGKEMADLDVSIWGKIDAHKTSDTAKFKITMAEITAANIVRAMGGRVSEIVSAATSYYQFGMPAATGEYEIQLCSPIARDFSGATATTTKCDQVITLWRCRATGEFSEPFDHKGYKVVEAEFEGLIRKPGSTVAADNYVGRHDWPETGDLLADVSSSGHGYTIT